MQPCVNEVLLCEDPGKASVEDFVLKEGLRVIFADSLMRIEAYPPLHVKRERQQGR
jgi:hypothetical protein